MAVIQKKLERRKERLTGIRKRPFCEVENSGHQHQADFEVSCNLFQGMKVYLCEHHSLAYQIALEHQRRLNN